MERAASADFQRDVHVLFEQMYDAIDRRIVDRDALRDLTDNLSDVIMPLTMAAATPVLKKEFDKPELNGLVLTPTRALMLSVLNDHFGKVVMRAYLFSLLAERNPGKGEHLTAKLVDVHICKLRELLKATPYGIRTDLGMGYALDRAENCPTSKASAAAKARADNRPKWHGVSFTHVGAAIMAYLEANEGKLCSAREIMDAVPGCKNHQMVYNTIHRARSARIAGVTIDTRLGFCLIKTK